MIFEGVVSLHFLLTPLQHTFLPSQSPNPLFLISSQTKTKQEVEDAGAEIWFERGKMLIACVVVSFLVSIVLVGIGHEYMVMEVHPVAAYIILACVLVLMGYVEALHYSCVRSPHGEESTLGHTRHSTLHTPSHSTLKTLHIAKHHT